MFGKKMLTMALGLVLVAVVGCKEVKDFVGEKVQQVEEAAEAVKGAKKQADEAAKNAQTAYDEAMKRADEAVKEADDMLKKAGHVDMDKLTPEERSEMVLGQKISKYVQCYNNSSERGHSTMQRYTSWCDAEKGPTGKERHIYGLFQLHNLDDCTTAAKALLTEEPAIPGLDEAAKGYIAALEKLEPAVKNAYEYYDQEDYKDDAMARGKELHGPLMEGFQGFVTADGAFRLQIETVNDKRQLARLEELDKDEARRLQYLHAKLLYEAKTMIRLESVGELKEVNVEELAKQIKSYSETMKQLAEYAATNDDASRNAGVDSFYLGKAKKFQKASKELMRRARDNKPYKTHEKRQIGTPSGWMVRGSPDKAIREYNDLVDRANRVKF
jgi:hypothetical protein